MYKCNKCGKEFEKKQSYIAHCRIHSGYVRDKNPNARRNIPSKIICEFCGEKFDDGRKLGGHITHCKLNPKHNEIISNMKKSGNARNLKWSDEDRKRISNARIKYLIEHPDKVPYKLNHSSNMSYPEKIFKNALESANIGGWVYNYQNSIYSYDFAFPEFKIDVEIDGNTHTLEKVKKIDERRDKFSNENGWIVIRFTTKEVKENVIQCIKKLQTYM